MSGFGQSIGGSSGSAASGALYTVALNAVPVDLSIVTDYTFLIPGGLRFFFEWAYLVCTSGSAILIQPTIRYGIVGTPAKCFGPTICTQLTAPNTREWTNSWTLNEGEESVSAGITIAGSGTNYFGRFFVVGSLY